MILELLELIPSIKQVHHDMGSSQPRLFIPPAAIVSLARFLSTDEDGDQSIKKKHAPITDRQTQPSPSVRQWQQI